MEVPEMIFGGEKMKAVAKVIMKKHLVEKLLKWFWSIVCTIRAVGWLQTYENVYQTTLYHIPKDRLYSSCTSRIWATERQSGVSHFFKKN